MAHQVPWSKIILETFIEEAALTEDEEKIIRTRVAGWTVVKQSIEFNMCVSRVEKIVRRLKLKYDQVQKYNPILPPRKFSAAELYMDNSKDPDVWEENKTRL